MSKKRPAKKIGGGGEDRGGKQPRSSSAFIAGQRIPRSAAEPTPFHETPLWAFRVVDLGGPWCWSRMDAPTSRAVIDKLKNFESMAWKDILKTGTHRVEASDLGKPARDRLVEIGQDDVDYLVSLRIDGPGRVWGILDERVLRILWWDPEHEVYPVTKRHT